MRSSSLHKLLYLLNLLVNGEYTKRGIIEKFEQKGLSITKPLINNYIQKYNNNGIKVEVKQNENREKVYYIPAIDFDLEFSDEELSILNKIKKVLVAQKSLEKIKVSMYMFYRLAKCIKDYDKMLDFINFSYYSTINWSLVAQLEQHCKNNDIIIIDYLLPSGGNKEIKIHAHSIVLSDWSEKLYLSGALENSKHLSNLPIDRIYMIQKVLERNVDLKVGENLMTYTVSKEKYSELSEDENEEILYDLGNNLVIRRPIDNEFFILQRLLCCCPDVYNISDEKIRDLFTQKLEALRTIYDKPIDK